MINNLRHFVASQPLFFIVRNQISFSIANSIANILMFCSKFFFSLFANNVHITNLTSQSFQNPNFLLFFWDRFLKCIPIIETDYTNNQSKFDHIDSSGNLGTVTPNRHHRQDQSFGNISVSYSLAHKDQ